MAHSLYTGVTSGYEDIIAGGFGAAIPAIGAEDVGTEGNGAEVVDCGGVEEAEEEPDPEPELELVDPSLSVNPVVS